MKNQFIRFLLVGVLNTIVGYSFYAFFIFIGLDYRVAALLGTICGVAFNYKSTGVLVFKSHDNSRIFHFVGVYVVVYFFNIGGISVLKKMGLNDYYSGAALLIPCAILSFTMNKFFVFKKNATRG